METLNFITREGDTPLTVSWDYDEIEVDAVSWLEKFGDRIGSRAAKLPNGAWVDLSQFAAITIGKED